MGVDLNFNTRKPRRGGKFTSTYLTKNKVVLKTLTSSKRSRLAKLKEIMSQLAVKPPRPSYHPANQK